MVHFWTLFISKNVFTPSQTFSDTVASYRIPDLKILPRNFEVIEDLAP